ncbi:unnamed protein product [Parnassius mnemosyne]|uniref:Serpin domain-containing protein n=1 Tax=Parnassius mnemosyne TaxID=213953 RepID=A0AAV1L559_9NEOP
MKFNLIIIALFSTCYCKVEFSDRARNFSVELLYYTAEETDWHTVISPFGVWSLLTGVSIGATGPSRLQLTNALVIPNNLNTLIKGYKSLTQSVLTAETLDVEILNKNYLFTDSDFQIQKGFLRSIQSDFDAKLTKLHFDLPEEAAAIANSVIQKSGATVSNVLRSDDFENSKMIITNVISFKGFWRSPFNVTDTRVEVFYDENKNEVGKVNMMFQQGEFPFSNIRPLKATALELPYGDDTNYSFLALLPYPGAKVADVYRGLESVSLKDILAQLQSDIKNWGLTDVLVSLPRFKISSNLVLNRPLNYMGVYDIFDPKKASFKTITEANNIFVSAIVHKADIEVTEFGTVASASTSAYFADRILPPSFHANRPFIYFVIEKTTATIIFSGVYSKPSIF